MRVLAGLAVLLAACGGGHAPARIRLTALAGTLDGVAAPAALEVLREDFETVPGAWRGATAREDPLAFDPALLQAQAGREGEKSFLTLTGRRGAFYRVVPVEPDTPYLFEGEVRARGLRAGPQDGSTPAVDGARFWLGELPARAAPEELFAGRNPVVRARPLASGSGVEGWQAQKIWFRTGAATRALLVMCQLWVPDRAKEEPDPDLDAGAADFAAVRLARIDERELWELEAARAVAIAHRGDAQPAPPDARARRRVDAMLAAEQRPALLLLPGERLRFELDVPEDEPVLEAGLAPWPATFRAGVAPGELWLRAGGRELKRVVAPTAATLAEIGWLELALTLAPVAGEHVTLEVGLDAGPDGGQPVVLGAPLVRARGAEPEGWNLVLISIDTLRSDHVGAYGAGGASATPTLDRLAREGLLFEDFTASAPYTLPAHASLFSGQFPSVHKVEDAGRPLAPSRSPVLARILAEHGFRTQAFTAAGFLTSDFGFQAGFDGFSIRDPLRHPDSKALREFEQVYPEQGPAPAQPGVERVKGWIAAHAKERFFLFVHTYEVHDYDPPAAMLGCAEHGCRSKLSDFDKLTLKDKQRTPFPGTPEDRAHVGHLYEAALRHVDGEVGELLDELDRQGLAARTLVVVTSDHGEEMFERGFLQHGKSLHREVLSIPLIVRLPGRAPARVTTPAMQVDVAPTLLALLGLPPDARMQGRDLLGARVPPRPIWSEVDDVRARQTSLRDGTWKLVHAPLAAPVRFHAEREWSLYDVAHDPEERMDLSAREAARLAGLQQQLEGFQHELDATSERLGPAPTNEIEDATRENLRKLGYGGGDGR